MAKKSYDRDILALDDTQLEKFARQWVSKKKGYYKITNFAGAGDRGRDVVGFLSSALHEGEWHNYQCKQLGKPLGTDEALSEIGKIFYYSKVGDFTLPTKMYFVAPRNLNRNLKTMVFNPSAFRKFFLENWEKYCAKTIVTGKEIGLDTKLGELVCGFDFANVEHIGLDELLEDSAAKSVLYDWFGADPGPAPVGVVPPTVQASELPYVGQLVDAYGEHAGLEFSSHEDVAAHADYWQHFGLQRERFFDADAFNRFYRDSTSEEDIAGLRREVYHGIIDRYRANYADTLSRIDAVMSQAANVRPAGVLGHHARTTVKQGLCHHYVNDGELKWKK